MFAPRWFLDLNGVALITLGIALIVTRPRPAASWVRRWGNLGTLWACLCCTAGALLLAMGLGYLQPLPRQEPPTRGPAWSTHR